MNKIIPSQETPPSPNSVSPKIDPSAKVAKATYHLEEELHLALEEIAHLQNALAEAEMKLATLENQRQIQEKPDSMHHLYNEMMEELNQPLTMIANYSDLLASQSAANPVSLQLRFAERIRHSLKQVRQIMVHYQQMTNPATAQSGSAEKVSLPAIIQEILGHQEIELKKKQLVLQLIFPENPPQIAGSEDEINLILQTLISNALAVTPAQETVSISVDSKNEDSLIYERLSIYDHGGGIPQTMIQNLFSFSNNQPIPGCTLTRTQLITLKQKILDQGAKFTIENSEASGTVMSIYFKMANS